MSTKIYSGYILDEGMNPFEMIPLLKSTFVPFIQKRIYETYFENLFKFHDLANYDDGKLSHVLKAVAKRHDRKMPDEITPPFISILARTETEAYLKEEKYQYQAEILFAQDPVTKRYLAYFLGGDEAEQMFAALEGVNDFYYYNNSDDPEDIDYEDWQERGRTWDRSVNLDDSLINSMLSLQTLSSFDLSCSFKSNREMMKLNPVYPDKEWRIDEIVHAIVLDDFFKENPDKKKDYFAINEALSNMPKITATQYEVTRKIGEDITPELLQDKQSEFFLK